MLDSALTSMLVLKFRGCTSVPDMCSTISSTHTSTSSSFEAIPCPYQSQPSQQVKRHKHVIVVSRDCFVACNRAKPRQTTRLLALRIPNNKHPRQPQTKRNYPSNLPEPAEFQVPAVLPCATHILVGASHHGQVAVHQCKFRTSSVSKTKD